MSGRTEVAEEEEDAIVCLKAQRTPARAHHLGRLALLAGEGRGRGLWLHRIGRQGCVEMAGKGRRRRHVDFDQVFVPGDGRKAQIDLAFTQQAQVVG